MVEQYIDERIDIQKIQGISSKIAGIENALNLTFNRDEFSLIEEVYSLLEHVQKLGRELSEPCRDLTGAKDGLMSLIQQIEGEYKQIKNEIDYWHQLLPEIYIPEIKDTSQLKEKLREIKNKCKGKYKSFHYLEQLYGNNLYGVVPLKEFVVKLETIFPYFEDLDLDSRGDIEKVEKVYDCIMKLKEIWRENIDELVKNVNFAKIDRFVERTTQIEEEYRNLRKDCEVYESILEIDEEMPTTYPELKSRIEKYKSKSISRLGKDFESLIRFLRDETPELNVDKQTLENFIKHIKPLIKEVLRL